MPNDEASMATDGKRHFKRAEFNAKASIAAKSQNYTVKVLNISLKGILVRSQAPLSLETKKTYTLNIPLAGSNIVISTMASLVHQEENTMGFRFDSIEADGMIHLRRLLELNLETGRNLEDELGFLMENNFQESTEQ